VKGVVSSRGDAGMCGLNDARPETWVALDTRIGLTELETKWSLVYLS